MNCVLLLINKFLRVFHFKNCNILENEIKYVMQIRKLIKCFEIIYVEVKFAKESSMQFTENLLS